MGSNGLPLAAVHLSFEIFVDNGQFVAAVHGTPDRPNRLRAANNGIPHTNHLAVWNGIIESKSRPFFCLSMMGSKLGALPEVQRWEFVVDMDFPSPTMATEQMLAARDLFSSQSNAQFRVSTFEPLAAHMSNVQPDDVVCFWFCLSPPGQPFVHEPNFVHPNLPEAAYFDFSPLKMRWDAQFLPNTVIDCVISKHRPGTSPPFLGCLANAGGGDCFFVDLA